MQELSPIRRKNVSCCCLDWIEALRLFAASARLADRLFLLTSINSRSFEVTESRDAILEQGRDADSEWITGSGISKAIMMAEFKPWARPASIANRWWHEDFPRFDKELLLLTRSLCWADQVTVMTNLERRSLFVEDSRIPLVSSMHCIDLPRHYTEPIVIDKNCHASCSSRSHERTMSLYSTRYQYINISRTPQNLHYHS